MPVIQRVIKDLVKHLKDHRRYIKEQKTLNSSLQYRIAALQEEVSCLKLADERRKYQVHVLLDKAIPKGSEERQKFNPGRGQAGESSLKDEQLKNLPDYPSCLDLLTTKNTFPFELKNRDRHQFDALMKRPPQV